MEIQKNKEQNRYFADSNKNSFLLLNNYRRALMGFAALGIYIFHEWISVFDEHHIRLLQIEFFIKHMGFCGVDIFLFLSGISLTYSISKTKSIHAFYYKRFKRILLPFLLVAVMQSYFEKWSLEKFWGNISGFNFFRYNMYSFLWFIPAICIFYLLFPLYYRLFSKASNKVSFTLCAMILWLIISLYVRDILRDELFGFTNRIPVFLIGILIGWLAQNSEIIFDRLTWILLGMMLVLGVYLAYLSTYEGMYILVPLSNCCVPNIMISCSISFLFSGFMNLLRKIRHIRFLETLLFSILSFYGMFSLEFYCLQEWLGDILISRLSDQYNAAVINTALFLIVTVTALMLYHISKYFWMLVDWVISKLGFFRPQHVKMPAE